MTPASSDLAASGLPARWAGRDRFVLLDTDFGSGEHFIACRQAWLHAAAASAATAHRCLHVIALLPDQPSPPAVSEVRARLGAAARTPAARELLAAWPPATPDFHRLAFDGGRVQLLLVPGPLRERLPQIAATVDAFRIHARSLSADPDPAWPQRLFKAAARLAAPGATLALPEGGSAAVLAALRSAGFEVDPGLPAASGLQAVYRPPHTARRPGHRPATAERHALVVGAGLAGCAAAWALAEQGWQSTVIDRHQAPCAEASGNPAGLFHGIVNPQDGAHARFNRAAALQAQRAVQAAITEHGVAGATGGLLRLEGRLTAAAMHALLQRLGLPADYVQAMSAEAASAIAGMPLATPCWHYPGGGWVQPAGLARSFLERAGARTAFVGGQDVAALRRTADAARWQLLDAAGEVLAESAVVVLANAAVAAALAETTAPLQRVRGQLSVLPAAALRGLPALRLPWLPVAGGGYVLPAIDGGAVFGATAQAGDDDGSLRAADHAANLATLGRLTGVDGSVLQALALAPAALQGRTAWRCVADDRLPLIGAVPDEAALLAAFGAVPGAGASRLHGVPRRPGLFMLCALGSRGITWAALGAQVLAAQVGGAPLPLPAGLLGAIDPARFIVRQGRRTRG